MQFSYKPRGVCATEMHFTIEDGVLTDISISDGCSGNLRGLCALVKDMPVDEIIARLDGILCGKKPTSCPDQLACALKDAAGR